MPTLNDERTSRLVRQRLGPPALTFLLLSLFTDLRTPANPDHYRQARALTTLAALTVNVITI